MTVSEQVEALSKKYKIDPPYQKVIEDMVERESETLREKLYEAFATQYKEWVTSISVSSHVTVEKV